jgi:RNA polymerase sigma-70 factor (sigma-E family)
MPPSTEVEEFDAYVRARTPGLLRAAFLLTGDQHLAEDLVQTALVRTHRAWRRVRDGNPDAYTRKVMYHQQISWWRRRPVPEILGADVPEPSGGRSGGQDTETGVVTKLAVRAALLKLPPRQRAVIVLRFFEDRTEVETAELLGVAVGTVKSQTAKALERLRSITPNLLDGRTSPSPSGGVRHA